MCVVCVCVHAYLCVIADAKCTCRCIHTKFINAHCSQLAHSNTLSYQQNINSPVWRLHHRTAATRRTSHPAKGSGRRLGDAPYTGHTLYCTSSCSAGWSAQSSASPHHNSHLLPLSPTVGTTSWLPRQNRTRRRHSPRCWHPPCGCGMGSACCAGGKQKQTNPGAAGTLPSWLGRCLKRHRWIFVS